MERRCFAPSAALLSAREADCCMIRFERRILVRNVSSIRVRRVLKRITQIAVRHGKVGVEPEGFLVLGDRFGVTTGQ